MYCLFFPEYPALAVRMALRSDVAVMVAARHRIVARTPELRDAGLALGESLDRARAMFPDAHVAERHPAREQAVWDDVCSTAYRWTPQVQSERHGILYLGDGAAERPAAAVASWDIQGGAAETHTLALLAAIRAGTGTLQTVSLAAAAAFLATWPVDALGHLGFGNDLVERCRLFGLRTLNHVRMLTRRHLHAQFGDEGLALHALMASLTEQRVVTTYHPPPTIEMMTHFDHPQREPAVLEPHLLACLQQAWEALAGRRCSSVGIRACDRSRGETVQIGRLLKQPSDQRSELQTVVRTLLRDLMGPDRRWSSMGVVLKGLVSPAEEQLLMFQRRPTADDVAVAVRRRYPDAMLRAKAAVDAPYLAEDGVTLERW